MALFINKPGGGGTLSGSALQIIDVELNRTQLTGILNGNAYEIVPAAATGKFLLLHHMDVEWTGGGNTLKPTLGANQTDIGFALTNSTTTVTNLVSNGVLHWTARFYFSTAAWHWWYELRSARSIASNYAFKLTRDENAPTGGGLSSGNSKLKISVAYEYVTK